MVKVKPKTMDKSHLVVVGFSKLVSHKYLPCFAEAIEKGYIDSYSIIDIESQKEEIEQRIKHLELKPEKVFYIEDQRSGGVWADPEKFGPVFEELISRKGKIKVYIATEVKAHEEYLRYCIENGIDSLTEKPIFAPMKNGEFNPSDIEPIMNYFVEKSKGGTAKHSIMTLSRYHKIYNFVTLDALKNKMVQLEAPITSLHFRTAGGVWNLHKEYEEREDHPYKYGYGMLMHGAYHYVDLITQFLDLNKIIFPNDTFTLTLSSFGAYPFDQNDRISKKISRDFCDDKPDFISSKKYGETDITTTFCLKNKSTGKVITLGTISLEQTTPSIRTWKDLPIDEYNKNGRISSVDLEVQLSVLHSVHVQCFDVPIEVNNKVEKIDAFARVTTRTNASLLKDEKHNSEETFSGLFHSDSNRALLSAWLEGKENKSQIHKHIVPMKVIQAIAVSLENPGHPITFDYI
ncbi:MAG: hypothetical protein LiPW41_532 [Parcubacteria group bacterium LiPW_41]|nr:MAG: hypothetical protein LiPW41_532 [Parcubacteria group bacterium LiPW_41]